MSLSNNVNSLVSAVAAEKAFKLVKPTKPLPPRVETINQKNARLGLKYPKLSKDQLEAKRIAQLKAYHEGRLGNEGKNGTKL